mgnify:CR=1 FL=1
MYGYDSRVRLSEVDQDRRMTLNAILNSFQDCSSFHSEDLGVGAAFVEQKKRMWVLSSWKIVIQRYPELAESIRVETAPYEFSKLTGRRNFRMLDGRGEMLACADSLWVYMDAVRKRPCRLEEDVAGAYTMEPRLTCMEYEDGHIQIPEDMTAEETFPVHRWHLDVNHHVNNGQYVQMAAEYLQKKGMIILDRNFRRGRNGEIDIVGRDGKYLVFVEVKYRSGTAKGNAAEAVTISKQRKICSVADYYRCLHNYNDNTWVRYDVVAIQGEKIQWIPNAFPHYYRTRG